MLPHSTLYTQAVYASTMGSNTTVAISIIHSVRWLEEASQTVKLWLGWLLLGSSMGNKLTPTVAIIATTASLEPKKLKALRRSCKPKKAMAVPIKPSTGTTQSQL